MIIKRDAGHRNAVRQMMHHYENHAKMAIERTQWYQTAPDEAKKKIQIRLIGVKGRIMSGDKATPCLKVTAIDTVIKEGIQIYLEMPMEREVHCEPM